MSGFDRCSIQLDSLGERHQMCKVDIKKFTKKKHEKICSPIGSSNSTDKLEEIELRDEENEKLKEKDTYGSTTSSDRSRQAKLDTPKLSCQ